MSSTTQFTGINMESYSDFSFVLRGETKDYKEDIKKLGGKYNSRLRGGPGWIFSKRSEDKVREFIKNGVRIVTQEEIKNSEERAEYYQKQRESGGNFVQSTTSTSNNEVLKQLKSLKAQMDRIEKMLNGLVVDEEEEDEEEEEEVKIPRKRLLQ